jgi:hypothetical protein
VPPGRHIVGDASPCSARSRARAAPSFSGPLHQPGSGIPAGTDEMLVALHLPSHGASWRRIYLQGIDNAEIIDAVHGRRAPMMAVSTTLRL